MIREDICKDKIDKHEMLSINEIYHYKFPKRARPQPRVGYASIYEIKFCSKYMKLPLSKFNDIKECPLCGKLHLYKNIRVGN